jgi:WD40 repeat protein
VRIWDPSSGRLLRTLTDSSDFVDPFDDSKTATSVAWRPDGQVLASAYRDGTVRLWNPSTGSILRTLGVGEHSDIAIIGEFIDSVGAIAWRPDGQALASTSADDTVRLWDPSSGRLLRTLEGHTGYVTSVAWRPDGRLLASASADKTVRLWAPSSGRLLRTLEGHTYAVSSVAWRPDGQALASASRDKTVRLWDTSGFLGSGRPLRTLEGHTDDVNSVVWRPGGRAIASVSKDHTVRIRDANVEDEMRRVCALLAGAELTAAEWLREMPQAIPYRKDYRTCPLITR